MTRRRFAKIDVHIRADGDYATLPDDSVRLAFIYTFLAQKIAGGLFVNDAQYDELVGRYAGHLPTLIDAGLVVRGDDGSLSARSYSDWQNDPAPSTERVRRWRARNAKRKTKRG